jgi:hypothetical protein
MGASANGGEAATPVDGCKAPDARNATTGFEPVSAETQPVSGRSRVQISDIENLASRDTPPESRLSASKRRDSWPETGLLATNLRKCRLFAKFGKSPGRDRGGCWVQRIRTVQRRFEHSAPGYLGTTFLRKRRDLRGAKVVISDAHEARSRSSRCRTRPGSAAVSMRNALAYILAANGRHVVSAFIVTAFA